MGNYALLSAMAFLIQAGAGTQTAPPTIMVQAQPRGELVMRAPRICGGRDDRSILRRMLAPPIIIINREEEFIQTGLDSYGIFTGVGPGGG